MLVSYEFVNETNYMREIDILLLLYLKNIFLLFASKTDIVIIVIIIKLHGGTLIVRRLHCGY